MNKKLIVSISIAIGILLLIVAGIYFVTPASHLPMFFPGYAVGLTKIHRTHAFAAAVLAIVTFIFAWFQSGKKSTK